MKRFSLCFIALVSFAGLSRAQTPQSAAAPSAPRALANNDATYVKLRNSRVGLDAVAVQDFTLKRDAGTFLFKSGAFYLLEPVNGKITGAVFLGDATFTLIPPIEVERRYLSILTRGQPFEEQFSGAVFRFTDGTDEELRKASTKGSAPASGDANGLLNDIRNQLRKKLKDNLDARLLEDVLSSRRGGKFEAFIKGKKYSDKMIYDVDPQGTILKPEEIALFIWDENHFGIWSEFHYSREYADGTANSDEQNGPFAIPHQKLDVTIEKSAKLNGTAVTTVAALQDGVRVLALDLFPTLRVQSVTGESGQQLSFIQEDKNEDPAFSVILPKELKKGELCVITTKYEGKDAISNEGGGNYYPIARSSWYPGLGFGSYTSYEMTFHIPKGMKIAATGRRLKEVDGGGENLTEWTTDVPQAVAGFNFGKFKREEGKPLKQPYLLETYVNPEPPDIVNSIQLAANGTGLEGNRMSGAALGTMSTVSLMKKAMAEAQLAIDIYTDYFGEAPYKRLAMTQQTAFNFGQSWPGLVYLPISYFFDSTVRHQLGMDDPHGYFKVVGPHEIAHQWWGHMVGFNSYRDQWMSEGFAEMSASIFIQYIYREHGLDDYHKFWADERQLMTERNREGKRAIDVGPVTLGYRLQNARSGFDIPRRLIYPKGGYILQMVRFMLWESRAQDPDGRFKAMMHEFTKTYANRPGSTEDFKAILEKYMVRDMDIDGNQRMDWFFNQYVYGTDYPTYKFEHSFSNDANGDVVLNMKITQSDVGQKFAMPVPVYLKLSNGRVARLGTARLVGNTTVEEHVPLKGLKEKPKRALLAYYDDVLGNIENH